MPAAAIPQPASSPPPSPPASAGGVPSLWTRVSRWVDDRINPIIVKELRQAVRSKFVTAAMMLFLVVALVVMGFRLMEMDDQGTFDTTAGREVFLVLQGVLLGSCLLFVPLYAAIRLAAERDGAHGDLLYVTTLKARSIVWGKLLSALTLTLLIFSLCAPFMVLTYLLRGIDLLTILLVLVIDAAAVIAATQMALFVAALPVSKIIKGFLGVWVLATYIGALSAIMGFTSVMVYQPLGDFIRTPDFWLVVLAVATAVATYTITFFLLTAATLKGPSLNRALPIRLFLTGAWLVGLAVTLVLVGYYNLQRGGSFFASGPSDIILIVWVMMTVNFMGLALLASASERDAWGPRVRSQIPRNPLGRLIAFIFYSGSAGGVLWCVLVLGSTFLFGLLWHEMRDFGLGIVASWSPGMAPSSHSNPSLLSEEVWFGSGSLNHGYGNSNEYISLFVPLTLTIGYVLMYTLWAMVIRRYFFAAKSKTTAVGAFAVMLMALASVVPPVLAYVAAGQLDDWSWLWMAPSPIGPMWMAGDGYRTSTYGMAPFTIFVLMGLTVAVAAVSPIFLEQWRRFRAVPRPERPEPPRASSKEAADVVEAEEGD